MHGLRSIHNSNKIEFYENCLTDLKQNLNVLEDEIKGHSITISTSFDNIRLRLSKDIKKLKDEMDSAPSDSIQVGKDLEEKIASHAVDVSGIMKELNIFKKENYITQKKLENIYTLIERLQKSEVIP